MFSVNGGVAAIGIISAAVLPPLVWLWFYLRFDRQQPEPPRLIALTFLAGGAIVYPTILVEHTFTSWLAETGALTMPLLIAWAFVEEVFKATAVWVSSRMHTAIDEPVDWIIYFISAALGFAAIENALFLFFPTTAAPLAAQAGYRFLGATLIHILASGVVGSALAWSWRHSRFIRRVALLSSLMTATFLHATFNIALLTMAVPLSVILIVVWIGHLALIGVLEYIPTATRRVYKTSPRGWYTQEVAQLLP